MLFVCYGMAKSASTFAFQLCKNIASIRSNQAALKGLLSEELRTDFVDHINGGSNRLGSVLATLNERIPEKEIYVVKTHQALDEHTSTMLANGHIKASVSFRDPYDIVVSLKDAGENERRREPSRRRNAFAAIYSYADATVSTLEHIKIAKTWLDFTDTDLCRIPFSRIANRPVSVARGIAHHMNVDIDPAGIVARYTSDKKNTITEFNLGEEGRGHEVLSIKDRLIREQFDDFLNSYF